MQIAQTASWIALFQLAACVPDTDPEFLADQLEPDGGCWDVDLSDGLDEESTVELHDLYTCLNQSGNFDSFSRFMESMDENNRFGEPIGLPLIRISNEFTSSQSDMLGLAGQALNLLTEQRDDALILMELLVEVAHGSPYQTIQNTEELDHAVSISNGLAVPVLGVFSHFAHDALDEGPEARASFLALTESDLLENATCFMEHMWMADDELMSPIGERAFMSVAEAWQESNDTSNDRTEGPSSNSLRNLLLAFTSFEEGPYFEDFQQAVGLILSDDRVQVNTKAEMLAAHRAGHLEPLVEQLTYLSNVDVNGRSLSDPVADDVSALQVGVRLLHRANRPLRCDLVLFDFNIENMAVRMLQELSQLSAGEVEDGLGFFTTALGGTLTPAILETAAGTGVCDGFSEPLLDDLRVLERLNDPEVGNFVAVMHALLDIAYQEGQVDRLPPLVDAVSQIYLEGLLPPIEEVLRDLHSVQAVTDAVALLPRLIEGDYEADYHCTNGGMPLNFDHIWGGIQQLISTEPSEEDLAFGLLVKQTERDEFWDAIDRMAILSQHQESRIHDAPALLIRLANNAEDTATDAVVESWLHNETNWNGVLATSESQAVLDAIREAPENKESPLAFMSRLVLSDTVTVMLQTIDVVFDSLGDE